MDKTNLLKHCIGPPDINDTGIVKFMAMIILLFFCSDIYASELMAESNTNKTTFYLGEPIFMKVKLINITNSNVCLFNNMFRFQTCGVFTPSCAVLDSDGKSVAGFSGGSWNPSLNVNYVSNKGYFILGPNKYIENWLKIDGYIPSVPGKYQVQISWDFSSIGKARDDINNMKEYFKAFLQLYDEIAKKENCLFIYDDVVTEPIPIEIISMSGVDNSLFFNEVVNSNATLENISQSFAWIDAELVKRFRMYNMFNQATYKLDDFNYGK